MIKVTRINNEEFLVNGDMIEFIEETPDTVLSLMSGRKVVVREKAEEVVALITEYKRKLFTLGPDRKTVRGEK